MAKICMFGTRTTSEEMVDIILDCGHEVIYYVENMFPAKVGSKLNEIPIIWYEDLKNIDEDFEVICGIASSYQRKVYVEEMKEFMPELKWATIIHPTVNASSTLNVGEGTLLSRGVSVGSHTKLGEHCFINRGVSLGHHDIFGDFVTVSPGATIAGSCDIGDGSYISMCSVIVDHTMIGKNTFVAAGAVVINDIENHTAVMGLPAKKKTLKEGSRVLERIDRSKYDVEEY
jgi:sugar O-acyltransferase (sialic acid O-acetyltransferase NeuD family)